MPGRAKGPAAVERTRSRGGGQDPVRKGDEVHRVSQRCEVATRVSPGAQLAQHRARAVREALLAAAGGIAGVGPAAGGMAAPHGSMTAFNAMRDGYLAHLALANATARVTALRERGPFKPAQVDPFKAGPDDIMVFADMLERCLKLACSCSVSSQS